MKKKLLACGIVMAISETWTFSLIHCVFSFLFVLMTLVSLWCLWFLWCDAYVGTTEKAAALSGDDQNGPWPAKRRRNSIYKNMGLLCCVSRPNYLWKLQLKKYNRRMLAAGTYDTINGPFYELYFHTTHEKVMVINIYI